MQASIARDANSFLEDVQSHKLIICIWQKGADALIDQYRDLEKSLPKGENLETMVLTKDELMKMAKLDFMVKDEGVSTTNQINAICKNISQLFPNKVKHLYIDECWITVPKKYSAHLTPVS